MPSLRSRLPELETLEQLLAELPDARVKELARVEHGGERLPIHAVSFGTAKPDAPTLVLIGGVHGLERIGSQVLIAYLEGLQSTLQWDRSLRWLLDHVRLSIVPLVNPVGVALGRRANGNGVDLMRNAPVSAENDSSWFQLYRGQRFSRYLPWFRGNESQLEAEAQAVVDFVRRETKHSRVAVTLDVHSGFLERDRIWFPYARSRQSFPNIAEAVGLRRLLRNTHRHHRYVFEPQALNYTTHGDLWDYIHMTHVRERPGRLLLPLTLEMSSASWYRDNPRQLLSRTGLFHPQRPSQLSGALHDHKMLLDFLLRATGSFDSWVPVDATARQEMEEEAEVLWFRTPNATPEGGALS